MSAVSNNQVSVSNTLGKSALTNGDFFFGVTGGDDYGPTSNSGFYNGVVIPAGGYVIYFNNSGTITANAPKNDAECLYWLKRYGYSGADNISDALTWASNQIHLAVRSSEYVIGDLPSAYTFTINSSDLGQGFGGYNNWNSHAYPVELGTLGKDGYQLTYYGGEPSNFLQAAYVPYLFNLNSQPIADFFSNLVTQGAITNAYETTLWDVTWAAGSTHTTGVVSLRGTNASTGQMYICMLDTSDANWNQNNNNSAALAGTYLFPATFTLRTPVVDKGGWC